MAWFLILVLCLFATFAGARGAWIVPIVLLPIDRLPWPAALLLAAVSFLAWRAYTARSLPPYPRHSR